MVTLNNVLFRIKLMLGIGRGVPTSFSDKDLMEVLRYITLPDYSRYFKNEMRLNTVRFTKADRVPGARNMYIIHEDYIREMLDQGISLDGIKSLTIAKYDDRYTEGTQNGTIYDPYPQALGNESMFSGMAIGAANHYRSRELWSFTKRAFYRAPHMIEFEHDFIDPESYVFDMVLWVTHPMNTATIPNTYLDSFLKLATYDIKIFLWNNELRALEGTETGRGSVKVPQWGDTEREREELIKEYEKLMIFEEIHIENVAE